MRWSVLLLLSFGGATAAAVANAADDRAAAASSCPAGIEHRVNNLFQSMQSGGTGPEQADATLAGWARDCPQSAPVHALGSVVVVKLASQTADLDKRLTILDRGLALTERARELGAVQHDARKRILHQMNDIERATGKQSAAFRSNAGTRCGALEVVSVELDTQTIAYHMANTGFVPGGFQFLSELAEACAGNRELFARRPLLYRARALIDRVKASPYAPDAPRWLASAERDIVHWSMGDSDPAKKAALIESGLTSVGISGRMDEARQLLIVSGRIEPLPMAQWFTAKGMADPGLVLAMALAFDDAAAQSEIANAYRPYRVLVSDMLKAMKVAGEPEGARMKLYLAAKAQSEGEIRRPANKDRPKPPDMLWNWLKNPPE